MRSALVLIWLIALTYPVFSSDWTQKYKLVTDCMSGDSQVRGDASAKLIHHKDLQLVPALVDALFYTPKNSRNEIFSVLESWTGEKLNRGYYEWVEWVGKHSEITPSADYVLWKVSLLTKIDPSYKKVLYADVVSDIRIEEIVWGGVRLDGIPSLDTPPHVPANGGSFLNDEELVFGISLNGERRAYPLRFMSWHEMANDTIGGEPITLSY